MEEQPESLKHMCEVCSSKNIGFHIAVKQFPLAET